MRKVGVTAMVIMLISAATGAVFWVGHANAPACERKYVFARDINGIPQNIQYYEAINCDTVFADHVFVILPHLELQTEPYVVSVRNVGTTAIYALARTPSDVIDPTVVGYTPSTPQLPILDNAATAYQVQPGQTRIFTAMPNKIAGAWFSQGGQ